MSFLKSKFYKVARAGVGERVDVPFLYLLRGCDKCGWVHSSLLSRLLNLSCGSQARFQLRPTHRLPACSQGPSREQREGGCSLPTEQFGGATCPGSWQNISASPSHHCQSLLHHPPATETMARCRGRSLGKEEKEKKHKRRKKLGGCHVWTAVIFRCEFPGPVEFCFAKLHAPILCLSSFSVMGITAMSLAQG